MLEFRAYMNEGGRVAYTGKRAGQQFSEAVGVGRQFYDPKGEGRAAARRIPRGTSAAACSWADRCSAVTSSTTCSQYWFGGFVQVANDGSDPGGGLFDINGIADPFGGAVLGLQRRPTARGTRTRARRSSRPAASCRRTTSRSSRAGRHRAGTSRAGRSTRIRVKQYAYSQIADVSYKRLTREIPVPAAGGDLTFWTSYDTEEHWDFFAVEARTAGGDDWTTLPDANGHTSNDTGDSCPAGWLELHPHLEHYQTLNAGEPPTCSPTGTSGDWNAASGNSNGWQQWSINLDAYAGQTVEISTRVRERLGVQGLGVFLDDVDAAERHQHVVRDGPRRMAGQRGAGGQRRERQRLGDHRRRWLPGGRVDHDARLAHDGLRVRGDLDEARAQGGHGRACWTTCSGTEQRHGGGRPPGGPSVGRRPYWS